MILLENLKIYNGDIREEETLNKLFTDVNKQGKKIDAVIHCAGLKSVKDSLINPLKYWDVNVGGTINLLKLMN